VEKHPDRFIIEPNLSPIKHRGVDNAIWEMEYWVEHGAKIFKYYSPEDTYINDPELWPFYKRAEELGIVLDLHTGFSWVPPGKSKYCLPIQIDDVARDFPNLKLVAFHMGYPYCDDLNMVAMGHPNVYLCLSLLVPWAISAPYKFGKILGEAMRFVGPDRIVWGTDSAGYGAQIGMAALGLRNFQIPEELQWQYGYLPLTDEDKRKIFGGNLAGLLGIDTTVRRIGKKSSDDKTSFSLAKTENEKNNKEAAYEVLVSTPMGELQGRVSFKIDGTALSGVLSLMNNDNPFSGGTLEDGKIAFSGEMKTPVGKMAYTVTGTFIDGSIEAIAKTKMGNLSIKSK
jgi:predicted TIM-barrel fold metal-dependent hydrolase